MYADECGPDGVCMSAMDSPGICGFSCQADSDCDQVGGGVCDATEGVCVDPDGIGLGNCMSVVRSRMVQRNVIQATLQNGPILYG